MITLYENIDRAVNRIDMNTSLFYQNKQEDAYIELDKTLQDISSAVDGITDFINKQGKNNSTEAEIIDILTRAMEALERKDVLLMSDILQYELKELLSNIRDNL